MPNDLDSITPTNASFDAPASITPVSDVGSTPNKPDTNDNNAPVPPFLANDRVPVTPLPIDPSDHTSMEMRQRTVIRRPPIPSPSPAEQKARDEADALRSLDDTGIRFMPNQSRFWENEQGRRNGRQGHAGRLKISTVALVCAVAALSFVAGGVFSRLSSQVPLLFPTTEEPQESPIRADNTIVPNQEEAEQPNTDETTWNEPETTYEPEQTYEPEEPSAPEENEQTQDKDTSLQWNFDDEGNSSVSYDYETNEVTIDYGDYVVSFDLDYLLGDPYGQAPEDGNGNGNDFWSPYNTDSNDSGANGDDPYDWSWQSEPQNHWSNYSAA